MKPLSLKGLIPADPINLSIKGKLISVVACFGVILITAWLSRFFVSNPSFPIVVASMGASAVILFIIPNSPLAQPWPLVGGQLVSAMIGVACARLTTDTAFASAYAAGGSVLAMLVLRCLHPPGAASALTPVMSGNSVAAMGYDFVLFPVALNVFVMLVLAVIVNRWLLRHEYPIRLRHASANPSKHAAGMKASEFAEVTVQDLHQAMRERDIFLDVSDGDLTQLLSDVQKHNFERFSGTLTCSDIMVDNVLAIDYGTEVEDAWKLMHREQLKALPVIDRARRVIGIITWHDFFKFISIGSNETFPEKFKAFIRRTPEVSTRKPEAAGHIMTSPVATLPESAHIADLIPLMSDQGYRQIPIVNAEHRLSGMVYQAQLIAALYHHQLAARR